MASHKHNTGLVRTCPSIIQVVAALSTYGRPTDKEFGVMGDPTTTSSSTMVEFEFYVTRSGKTKQVDATTGAITCPIVRKDEVHKARLDCLEDGSGVLEVYTGSAKSLEVTEQFLAELDLGVAFAVEPILVEIESSINTLRNMADKKFEIVNCKLAGYEDGAEPSASGVFTVKLSGTEQDAAFTFVTDHVAQLQQAKIKFKGGKTKKAMSVTLRPTSYFTYSCTDIDNLAAANIVRQLAGIPERK